MREMTEEEEEMAAKLFKSADRPPPHKGEGDTHLTVRFDNTQPNVIFYGPHERDRRIRIPGAVVLRYTLDTSAKTPTGGKYVKQSLMIRTRDGRKWTGTLKQGTDVVILKRKKEKE